MTTGLAIFLNSILKLILTQLQTNDTEHYEKTGVRRCWIVGDPTPITNALPSFYRPPNADNRGLVTMEFSTLYTTLDLEDAIEELSFKIDEAFRPIYTHIKYPDNNRKDNKPEWVSGRVAPNANNIYTPEQIKQQVRILITNTYIQNGDTIRKQVLGLPMGTNPAPNLANIHLSWYESHHMDKLMQEGKLAEARLFYLTFRYIDDILSIDTPNFENHVKTTTNNVTSPIYPGYLELNKTSNNKEKVEFLGMDIDGTGNRITFNISNSKTKFPSKKINCPSLHGNFPQAAGYGVYTGQLHRFSRICTNVTDFVICSAHAARELLPKGFSKNKLTQKFIKFTINKKTYRPKRYMIYVYRNMLRQ